MQFGKYGLIRKLATGGMAEIFLARQDGIEGFSKDLVIKRILPIHADNTELIEMFLDEARIAATLNHPNIVQIFDLGRVDGEFFIAMEYVHGQDLRRICERGLTVGNFLPLRHASRIIADAAAGLHYAHMQRDSQGEPLNIVHRDVSPQNIVVSFDGVVKILDFGIAKAANKIVTTRHGQLKGKYAYMSPEQVNGLEVDHRSDIFSLGTLLYEITVCTRLFKADTDVKTIKNVSEAVVTPPSQIRPEYPRDLEEIVMRSLTQDPRDRFQNGQELQEALEDFLRNNRMKTGPVQLGNYMREIFPDKLERPTAEPIAPRSTTMTGLSRPSATRSTKLERPAPQAAPIPSLPSSAPVTPISRPSGLRPAPAAAAQSIETEEAPTAMMDAAGYSLPEPEPLRRGDLPGADEPYSGAPTADQIKDWTSSSMRALRRPGYDPNEYDPNYQPPQPAQPAPQAYNPQPTAPLQTNQAMPGPTAPIQPHHAAQMGGPPQAGGPPTGGPPRGGYPGPPPGRPGPPQQQAGGEQNEQVSFVVSNNAPYKAGNVQDFKPKKQARQVQRSSVKTVEYQLRSSDDDEPDSYEKGSRLYFYALFLVVLCAVAYAGYLLYKDGVKLAGDDFMVQQNEDPLENITPEPPPPELQSVMMHITSVPSGANVVINGILQSGETPGDFKIVPGKINSISLYALGHRPTHRNIEGPDGGDVEPIQFDLKSVDTSKLEDEKDYGKLTIESVPEGAMVFHNGRQAGRTPLIMDKVLANQEHHITLRKEGFHDHVLIQHVYPNINNKLPAQRLVSKDRKAAERVTELHFETRDVTINLNDDFVGLGPYFKPIGRNEAVRIELKLEEHRPYRRVFTTTVGSATYAPALRKIRRDPGKLTLKVKPKTIKLYVGANEYDYNEVKKLEMPGGDYTVTLVNSKDERSEIKVTVEPDVLTTYTIDYSGDTPTVRLVD